jgi:hypothetical protein
VMIWCQLTFTAEQLTLDGRTSSQPTPTPVEECARRAREGFGVLRAGPGERDALDASECSEVGERADVPAAPEVDEGEEECDGDGVADLGHLPGISSVAVHGVTGVRGARGWLWG